MGHHPNESVFENESLTLFIHMIVSPLLPLVFPWFLIISLTPPILQQIDLLLSCRGCIFIATQQLLEFDFNFILQMWVCHCGGRILPSPNRNGLILNVESHPFNSATNRFLLTYRDYIFIAREPYLKVFLKSSLRSQSDIAQIPRAQDPSLVL